MDSYNNNESEGANHEENAPEEEPVEEETAEKEPDYRFVIRTYSCLFDDYIKDIIDLAISVYIPIALIVDCIFNVWKYLDYINNK